MNRPIWSFFACTLSLLSGCGYGSYSHLPQPRPVDEEEQAPAVPGSTPPVTPNPSLNSEPDSTPAVPAPTEPSKPAPTVATTVPNEIKLSEVELRRRVINQLKKIGQAFEKYREQNSEYPSRTIGPQGQLSWRV